MEAGTTFTGIIEDKVKVEMVRRKGKNTLIDVNLGKFSRGLKEGDSLSINGVCLTIVNLHKKKTTLELVEETLQRTNLGDVKKGDFLNLERSLKLSDRLNGHLVLGHVDGIGKVVKREDFKGSSKIWVRAPKEIIDLVLRKGSITLDGVSLTVVDLHRDTFSVVLIPHTMKMTTLGRLKESSSVNIEVDVIGKWVKKILVEMEA